jgi:hypothetical protein
MVQTSQTPAKPTIVDLISRVLEPENGSLHEELARFILTCRFPSEDQRRLRELAEKRRRGTLSEIEEAEMDRYIKAADFIEVLKAKAAASLGNRSTR